MKIDKSEKVLGMQLSWVRAADAKVAPVFAINIAMLGVVFVLIKTLNSWTIPTAIFTTLCVLPLFCSVVFLALATFPRTSGPKGSNIFFGGITKMKEDVFIKNFCELTEVDYRVDVLSQTYRNSEIAKEKFKFIKFSFIASFISIPFWLVSIYCLYS